MAQETAADELEYGDKVLFKGKEYTVRVHYDIPSGGEWAKSENVKIERNGFPKYVPRDKLTVVN